MINWLDYLPPMLTGEELNKALFFLPPYTEDIRNASPAERLLALSDLYKVYIPQTMAVEIYHKLYLSVLTSLQKKETKEAIQQSKETYIGAVKGQFRGIIGGSDSFTIIGKSGIGKSSAIERAITLITQNKILEISNPYLKVIPILQVQCPFDCSSKALLLEILRVTDEMIGTNYYRSGTRSGVTTDTLIGLVSQVCLNHIGLLIIDEIQHILKSKTGGLLVNMMLQMINSSGISVCFVGVPESEIFFQSEMQLARRMVGLKYYPLRNDERFSAFCEKLYEYQYTCGSYELTSTVIQWLYDHSQGNVSIVVGLLKEAQQIAITTGIEKVDIDVLNMAYEERFGMLHDRIAIEKKRVNQTSKVSRKQAIYPIKEELYVDNIEPLAETIVLCKENGLDVVEELKKLVTVEVVVI